MVLLDRERSGLVPTKWLTEPGSLAGHWLSPQHVDTLQVREATGADLTNPNCQAFPSDCFVITIGGSERHYRFTAAYGSFFLYAVDVVGDGVEAMLLEYGTGRGTSVHEKHLTIVHFTANNTETLLQVQLSGYVPGEFRGDPPAWVRRYSLVASRASRSVDIVTRLIPPPYVPRFFGYADTLAALQYPRLVFRYRPDLSTYEIAEGRLIPLSAEPADRR